MSVDIGRFSKLTSFFQLRIRETVSFLDQIISAFEYLHIFPREMKTNIRVFSHQIEGW